MKKFLHPIAYLAVAFASYKVGTSLTSDALHPTSNQTNESVSNDQSQEITSTTRDSLPLETAPIPKQKSLKEIFATSDYHTRYANLKTYFQGITSENVEQYLIELGELPPGAKTNGITRNFFSSWGKVDGLAAFEYAQQLSGRDRLGYLSAAATGWAEQQPTDAWNAIMDISNNGSMFGISSYGVLNAISRNDLKLAVDLSLQVKDERRRSSHFSALVRDVSFRGNYKELFEVASALENPSDKNNLVKSIFETWGKYETDAPNELMATIADPKLSNSAMQGLMSGWAAVDGSGAFAYALENRDNPGMEESLESIAKTWSRSVTAPEMETMMTQIEAAENSSKLMQSMIFSVAQANPQLAMNWATSAADEQTRGRAINSTMTAWSRTNIDEAENYYHSMPDENMQAKAVYSVANGLLAKAGNDQRVLALLDGFEDPKAKSKALSTIGFALSRSKTKSKELQSTLRSMIETDPNMNEKQKASVLKRL